ncbi:FadR/GntR family transcriptional regulator [Sphaerochaeta sp. PS]|uniref:FadR/GntR family transcriptional regulator n=1 Tax=Sphaerochaeta sp. PS TaxID=3076336 RepID=UPI0028A49DB2|nr:FadR/GntR family transcriptional regulator [Sphaerochaeta sp. PS]MDT4761714.1 FadR/GntR family transcriptional regulator [Sphaerochaeta sp. PS]
MKEIKRIPVTTQVMDSIKESIIEGKYPIGTKLPTEVKLCEMLNVSRSTVREAMRSLQSEGFIELVAGKGAFVLDNQGHDYDTIRTWFIESAPNLKDSTEVREALESLQVSMAVKRGTEEELEALKEIHRQFVEENKTNNVSALANLDEQFHTQICAMAHNPLLNKINVLTARDLRKYRYKSISVKKNSDNTIREHALIIQAIEERNPNKASTYMLAHLESSLADINKVLEGQK